MTLPTSGAVTGISLWRYRVPLKYPLHLGKHRLDFRLGLLLEWRQTPDRTVWSEIAPLPGFSQESPRTCITECRHFFASHHFQGTETNPTRPTPRPPVGAGLAREPAAETTGTTTTAEIRKALQDSRSSGLSPSVRFGLESGLLQLTETLPIPPPPRLCLLVSPDARVDPTALSTATCVKMKVGRTDLDTERNKVRRLVDALPPAARLRLDANRAWTLEQAAAFCAGLDRQRIEYLEEPLHRGLSYGDWHERIPVPFAWDETLRERSEPDLNTAGLRALVLKPMLTGLSRTRALVEQARAREIAVVLSGAYESNLSLDLYAQLAALWSLEGPHGLDTFRPFALSLLQPAKFFRPPTALPILCREQLEPLGRLL